MSDSAHQTTIDRWSRKIEKLKEKEEESIRNMKKALSQAIKDPDTHRNIAQELLDARRNPHRIKHRESFGDDGEIITGYEDELTDYTRD